MNANRHTMYTLILTLNKKIPIELITILFNEWKIGKIFFKCDNILCSNLVEINDENIIIKNSNIYSICSTNCNIHFYIQYILKNDVHYEEKADFDDFIYGFIGNLSKYEKQQFINIYPEYFIDYL